MKVLIVDDEKNIRESIARFLSVEKITCDKAENGLSAKRKIEEGAYDLIILDLKMPGMTGSEVLAWMREAGVDTPVIMISAYGEISDAVEAMKMGAKDYIVKPFDPDELLERIKIIADDSRIKRRIENTDEPADLDDLFIGRSPEVIRIKGIIKKIARTVSTVLITGESGTGKEVAARAIHLLSERKNNDFVTVNIGGIPDTLLESELFGHEKGAFTGAVDRKIGMFEIANGGTLFLDEIGDMPMQLQVKLLRVLQEKKIKRLGATVDIPIDVRIIAATNKDLETLIRANLFREDLFFRLNVIHINLPPLRERGDDIPELSGFIINKLNKRMEAAIEGLSESALNQLKQYHFPGNIRELENILERAFILTESTIITEHDLGLPVHKMQAEVKPAKYEQIEKEAIIAALQKWEGNRTKAAEELGISRRTIINKIKKYTIDV